MLRKRLKRDFRLSAFVFGDGGATVGAVDMRRRLSGLVMEVAEVGVGASTGIFCWEGRGDDWAWGISKGGLFGVFTFSGGNAGSCVVVEALVFLSSSARKSLGRPGVESWDRRRMLESSIEGGDRVEGLFVSDTDGTDVDRDGSRGDVGDDGDAGSGIVAATWSSPMAPSVSVDSCCDLRLERPLASLPVSMISG